MDDMIPIIAIVSHSVPLLLTVLVIVAVLVLSYPLKRWIAMKERATDQASGEAIEKAAQYAAKIERLEQRLAVVERILTDRSTSLSDEIDRLRDTPLN